MSITKQRFKNKLLHPLNGVKGTYYRYFNRWKFRFLGVKLGRNADIRNKVYLHIADDAIASIGDQITLLSGDNLNPLCGNNLTGITLYPQSCLTIGHNFGMSGGAIWCTQNITIGNHVNIGANCIIVDADMHNIDWRLRRKDREETIEYKKAPVIIDDDVWIGVNCIILKGVHIGSHSIIGAGSVVTKDIPADCIASGNPCGVIRYLK